MSQFLAWLDDRTGFRKLARAVLFHQVPGGSRWRHALANAVLFALLTQIITGVALWFCYSPGAQTAWASVFYLQNDVPGGWFLRGLHHFNAQLVTVFLALRLAQIIIDGSCKAPREVNFWVWLALLVFVLAASVTGWLLPWDQKGYWATKVPTNIISITPIIGPALQRLMVGGSQLGQLTLMRFFALHAGIIPGCLLTLVVVHFYLFRRHGYAAPDNADQPSVSYWPDQALRDAIGFLTVAALLVVVTVAFHGAELTTPADATENYSAARPEWFFLPLYQFLKLFPGGTEVFGAMVIPGVLFLFVFLMPFSARQKSGQRFNVALILGVAVAAGVLLWRAVAADRADPAFLAAKRQLEIDSARVKVLAQEQGIPPSGALTLLQHDPQTQGPRLFARYCASCHRYDGHNGMGIPPTDKQSASDLKGFGSRAWLGGLLDPAYVDGPNYFGGTAHKKGKMVKFVKTKVAAYSPDQRAELTQVIAALSADAQLDSQKSLDATSASDIKAGAALFSGEINCADCHQFHTQDANADAPDLTGWASRDWLISFIGNPKQSRFYGDDNDRMPAFLDQHILDSDQIALIADWLRAKP
jgi:ubiquinol-cytochrome c reductase cytochrome b subunit